MSQFQGVATGSNREKYTIKEYLIYGGSAFLIFGMFVLYAFELEYFPRYINISSFLITALTGGLIFGIGLAYFFRDVPKDATEIMQLYIACIISSLVFAPLIFSLTNRIISLNEYEKKVQIVQVDKRITSRFGSEKGKKVKPNLLIVTYLDEGKHFDFTTKYLTLQDAKRGDIVGLKIKKGLLGFEYIVP